MWDFGRVEWRTARKPHKCSLCGKEIQKGERYKHAAGKADGEFYSDNFHKPCAEIFDMYFRAHDGDDEWCHAWIINWLRDYCQDYCEQFGKCGKGVFECEKIREITIEFAQLNSGDIIRVMAGT